MSSDTVGDYLLGRLQELGVRHLFGVPGDYVLGFNAQIEATPGVQWVANCNELNAAYAAEGYARVHGVGAFVVTAGVGDLGAASGVCGALAERSSVVAISGVPGAARPRATHHTAGDGDFSRFERIYREITVAHTTLTAANAAAEIDRVLAACVAEHGPVFIALPADVLPIEISPPAGPLQLRSAPDADLIQQLTAAITGRLAAARRPVVLIDAGVRQARLAEPVATALAVGAVPWAVTGSAVADLTGPPGPGYLGVYPGGFGHRPAVEVDDADLIIRLGVRRAEGAAPRAVDGLADAALVDITENGTSVGPDTFDVPMDQAVEALVDALPATAPPGGGQPSPSGPADGLPSPRGGVALTQDVFWEHFWDYLQSGDVVLADPGSGHFPMASGSRPDGVTLLDQKTWAAIGWALPAALGAELAAPGARHVVVIGDGAIALTVQELSTIAREGCSPLVVVVDNGGYLIEDLAIYGQHLDCDDIWVWDYPALAAAFDDRGRHHPLGLRVTSAAEIPDALKKAAEAQREGRMVVLDAVFDRYDMPASMRAMHEARIAALQQAGSPVVPQASRS
jgi:TPP-dependent 2-oxoacid decarboxylase